MEKNKPLEINFPTGVIEDKRTPEEKEKDFKTEELFGAPVISYRDFFDWQNDQESKTILETLKLQNQAGSSSCLAQAGALALAINNWLEEGQYKRMSARSIYLFRMNSPGGGMWAYDLGNIATQKGVVFEELLPSELKDEAAMNDKKDFLPSYEQIAKIYKANSYIWLSINDIDQIANVLSLGKPVVLCLNFGNGEWAKEVPTIIEGNNASYGHGITALPKAFFTYQGKKAILIQDSWGVDTGLNGRRILTEDWFLKGRVKAALWFEDLKNLTLQDSSQEKPVYQFKRNLIMGSKGYDVAMLQRCLGYLKDDEGYLFPLNIEPTGNYAGITRSAVKRFQKIYQIPQTGIVNSTTREALNILF